MKARSCRLVMAISNDTAQVGNYEVKPLSATVLRPDFVAGFRLLRLDKKSPPYLVRLSPSAVVTCTCPAFVKADKCKHASALVAAGLLPVRFIELLWEDRTVRSEERELAARVPQLEKELALVTERALQLQTQLASVIAAPKARRRSPRRKAVAA